MSLADIIAEQEAKDRQAINELVKTATTSGNGGSGAKPVAKFSAQDDAAVKPTVPRVSAFGKFGGMQEANEASKNTRTRKVIVGAAQGTASALTNALGMFADLSRAEQDRNAALIAKQTGRKTEDVLAENAEIGRKAQELMYGKADALSEKSQQNIESAKQGLGKVGQTLVDVGVAGTQMLGDMAANLIVPGSGLTAMGVRVFGMGAQEQRLKGGSEAEQFLGGLKSAAIEVLTERLGGITLGGKKLLGGVGKAVDKAIDSLIKSKGLKAVIELVRNGGVEAIEEIISGLLNPLADRALDLDNQRGTGNKVFTSEDVENMIHDGIVGGILGLVGGGTQVAKSAIVRGNAPTQRTADDNIRDALGLAQPTTAQNAVEAATAEERQITPPAVENGTDGVETADMTAQDDVQRLVGESSVSDAVEQVRETALAEGRELTAEQALTEIAVAPDVYGVTAEQVAEYAETLPQGTGAMSARNEADMSVGERWQAQEQGKDNPQMFETSRTETENLQNVRHRATGEVPMYDLKGGRVSKAVNTAVNSPVTPNEVVRSILDDAAQGKYDMTPVSEKSRVRRAKERIKKLTWQGAFAEYRAKFGSGILNADEIALGEVLYDYAVNAASEFRKKGLDEEAAAAYADAMSVLQIAVQNNSSAGQALQAASIWTRLSPVTKLYQLQKTVDHVAEESPEGVEQKRKQENAEKKLGKATKNAIKETAKEISEGWSRSKKSKPREHQPQDGENTVFTFEYVDEIGQIVASGIDRAFNPKPTKEKTLMRQLSDEVLRFARETAPKREGKTQLTPTELLRDYFANKDTYLEAWSAARDELMRKYADDPEMLEKLEPFISGTPQVSEMMYGAIMGKAITQAAIDSEVTRRDILTADVLGAGTQTMADRISAKLVEELGVDGMDAELVRAAVANYVDTVAREQGAKKTPVELEKLADNSIKSALRKIGAKLSQMTTMSESEKNELLLQITYELAVRYDIAEADIMSVYENIANRMAQMITEASHRQLSKMYGRKDAEKSKPTKEALQDKLTKLLRLGAFDEAMSEDFAFSEGAALDLFENYEVKIDKELQTAYLEALEGGTSEQIDTALKAIYQNVADQLHATFGEKLRAWRYTAMLFNPRTWTRNLVGNAGFAPFRALKNVVGTGLEALTLDTDERTKSILNRFNDNDAQLLGTAKTDFDTVMDVIMAGGKYDEGGIDPINELRTIFGSKFLEGIRKTTKTIMDKGDIPFARNAYARSLAGFLKARGVTAEQFLEGEGTDIDAIRNEAREYAIAEAQKATYRDVNRFTEAVNNVSKAMRNSGAVGDVIAGAAMPFVKTPANVAVRAVEYSPVALIDTMTRGSYKLRNDPSYTASDYIDDISKGFTGTALVGLGMLLATLGLLSGGGDDEDELDKLRGVQDYSINVGNRSYTLSWFAPAAMPMFLGVELTKTLGKNGDNANFWSVMDSVLGLANPMLEMSMLSGLNDTLNDIKYADQPIPALIAVSAANYLTQFVPSVFGTVERITEPTRKSTFIDKNKSAPSSVQTGVASAMNKLPREYQQITYYDAWGRPQSNGNIAARIANNTINPGNVRTIKTEKVEKELDRLAKLGYDGMMPERPSYSEKVNKKYLTAAQYEKYSKDVGEGKLTTINSLQSSSAYKELPDEAKAKAVIMSYQYAKAMAQSKIDKNVSVEAWTVEARDSGNVGEYIAQRAGMSTYTSNVGNERSGTKAMYFIDNGYTGDKLSAALSTYVSESAAESFKAVESKNGNLKNFASVYDFFNTAEGEDADGDGKIDANSKKEKVENYIRGLDISEKQKAIMFWGVYPKAKSNPFR